MSAQAAVLAPTHLERGRSLADLVLTGCLVLLTLGLVGTGIFLLTGGKALIVRSGSMAPVIGVGDLVVSRTIEPTEAKVGDIITFTDPTRDDALVTHRVRRVRIDDHQVHFVTKGDANGAVERWTIDSDGTIGRMVFSVPKVGYAVSWAAQPEARFTLIVLGGVLLAYAGLRRIWSS